MNNLRLMFREQLLLLDLLRLPVVGLDDAHHSWLPPPAPDLPRQALLRPLCPLRRLHHHLAHPHRGQQLRCVLQEQALEE